MDTIKIRLAADTVRRGWTKDRYHEKGASSMGVCMLGALALTVKPELAITEDEYIWEGVVDSSLEDDRALVQALWLVAEERRKGFDPQDEKRYQHFVMGEKVPAHKVSYAVCLVNMTVIKDGEDAAAFLEGVAANHAALIQLGAPS